MTTTTTRAPTTGSSVQHPSEIESVENHLTRKKKKSFKSVVIITCPRSLRQSASLLSSFFVLMLSILFLLASCLFGAGETLCLSRRDYCVGSASLLVAAKPAWGLEREFSNSNAIFKEDYWYAFGTKPIPVREEAQFNTQPPFVRIQTRYDAYNKYAPKVKLGLSAFRDLRAALASKDAPAVADAKDVVIKSLRPAGLLANNLLVSESVTSDVLLARYYVNEVYFRLTDIEQQNSPIDILDAALPYFNSYLICVNRAIPPKVGEKFALLQ